MTKEKVGHGVFSWDGSERRSGRYGAIQLFDAPYEGSKVCSPWLSVLLLPVGSRVRITAVVVETRDSGHLGDMFLGILPSRPELGEEVDLGVGILETAPGFFKDMPAIVLHPKDGRKVNWFDPRKLYHLHDQTVDLYVEETTDDFSAAPDIKPQERDGVLSTGEADGSFQVRGISEEKLEDMKIAPEPKRIGKGMFVMDSTPEKGKRFRWT